MKSLAGESNLHTAASKAITRLGGVHIGFPELVQLCMATVETYSAEFRQLSGHVKKSMAHEVVPLVCQLLLNEGLINKDHAEMLKEQALESAVIFDNLIEAFVWLSKNPEAIQAVVDTAKGCCCGPPQKG